MSYSKKITLSKFTYSFRKSGDNIAIDLREIGWEVEHWIHLAQDTDQWRAVVNTVMNLWVE
jgi:hypothetical protein